MKKIDFQRISRYFTRDKAWEAIVVIFIVLIIGNILLNSYIFWIIDQEAQMSVTADVKTKTIRQDLLKSVLDSIKEQEARFDQSLKTKPDIPDPSL